MQQQQTEDAKPFISDTQSLPEITFKAIILSIILTIVLGAANAYLGLKVGLTISASIPAAVISMAVLRLFKNSNVLENNIVQTAASSGEALTAGIIFTVPALIVIHFWTHFNYFATASIAILGGLLGVLFSVPLRRVLLADKALRFPEGTAIGNVLRVSAEQGPDQSVGIHYMVISGGMGALISVFQTGFKLLADGMQFWFAVGNTIIGAGIGFNPALIGAGYIMGANVALSVLAGIFIGWIFGVPIIAFIYGIPTDQNSSQIAMTLWGDHIRYIGLGVMVVGGLWAVVSLVKPIYRGIALSFQSVRQSKQRGASLIPRTQRDLPITTVLWGVLILLIPIYFTLNYLSHIPSLHLSNASIYGFSFVNLIFLVIGAFVFSSICAYFAGLVGSSANPLSSLALIALILSAFLTIFMLKDYLGVDKSANIAAAAISIIITAFIAAAAAISNDTIQDLKAGAIVGATPWKQQVMLMVGVVVAALVIPLILQLLFDAYGLAGVFPHPNMDPQQMLLAPQASLVAAIAQGIFTNQVNWAMMITGSVIAIICLLSDYFLNRAKGWRIPVLAVGLGIYLPVDTSTPLVIGGLLSYFINKKLQQLGREQGELQKSQHCALLLACGLVAGAAIMGVLLAIPFVIEGSSNALRIIDTKSTIMPQLLGLAATVALCLWIRHKVITSTDASVS